MLPFWIRFPSTTNAQILCVPIAERAVAEQHCPLAAIAAPPYLLDRRCQGTSAASLFLQFGECDYASGTVPCCWSDVLEWSMTANLGSASKEMTNSETATRTSVSDVRASS